MFFWFTTAIFALGGLAIAALGHPFFYNMVFGGHGGNDDAPDTWTASSRD
jgi:hypothetical protein